MPSSETDHSHGEKVVSDQGREMFAVGKAWWRRKRNGRMVVGKERCLVPCRCACHGKAGGETI